MCKAKDTLLRQPALLLLIPRGAQRRATTILLETCAKKPSQQVGSAHN
jgi:hypothetical protein